MSASRAGAAASIRKKINHPVIDADGHWSEPGPLFLQFLKEIGGERIRDKFVANIEQKSLWYQATPEQRNGFRMSRPPWWTAPTETYDKATSMLPALLRERLDEFGIDVGIIYPTLGLGLPPIADEELRIASIRATNAMTAELFAPHKDRLLPVAIVPTHNPREAVEGLRHAVQELRFRGIVIGTGVRRSLSNKHLPPIGSNKPGDGGYFLDNFGLDSAYDYDPFWRACVDLKVAVTAHSGSAGWPDRASPTSFVYNHLGRFATANDAFCKSLILGGVLHRFPTLNVGFLEGGTGWSAKLYNDMCSHWKARNRNAMAKNLNPRNLDLARLRDMIQKYGEPKVKALAEELLKYPSASHPHRTLDELADRDQSIPDEFAQSGISSLNDLNAMFDRCFFGCEADDVSVAWAFKASKHARLRPIFGSDIAHWDVTDMSEVLPEAYELIEDDLITPEDFREFTYLNAALMHTRMNPEFFAGTTVYDAVKADVAAANRKAK